MKTRKRTTGTEGSVGERSRSGAGPGRGGRLATAALGAGLLTVLPATGSAQVPPDSARPDTVPRDTTTTTVPSPRADSTATLRGTVASMVSGREISGARILVPELNLGGISNADGTFEITSLPPGIYNVKVEYLGYSTNQRPIRLRAGHVTRATFLLEQDVLEVADLVVEVKRTRRLDVLADFRRRMERGWGHFITRDEIEERNPQYTSDLFRRIPSIYVTPVRYGRAEIYVRRGGMRCQPDLWLDGILTHDFPVDNLQPDAIAGIEVYRRASEIPPQFQRGTCGAIVMWTRSGPDNPADGSR